MKTTICLFLLTMLSAMGCNKDNDALTSPAVGRWKVKPTILRSYVSGAFRDSTIQNSEPTDYFEFKANGTAEARGLGRIETFPYAINGDTITINARKGKINTLTANTFSYTLSDTLSVNFFTTATWNLYK